MVIYIPTLRRPHKQATYRNLGPKWKARVKFVLDEEDAKEIRAYHPEIRDDQLVLFPQNKLFGYTEKQAWIFENATEEKIAIFDDDLRFEYRISDDSTFLAPTGDVPEVVDFWMDKMFETLDEYPHVGFGPRQHNNTKYTLKDINAKMMCARAFRRDVVVQNAQLRRLQCKQDYDINLQLLRKGFANCVYHNFVAGQSFDTEGGCGTYRTLEMVNEAAMQLRSLHPEFVRVVDREYKNSLPRLEVVVQWKKAFGYDLKEAECS